MKTYTTPHITTTGFYKDMQKQSHILIGGTTGSGKSNFVNGFIHSLLSFFPDEMQLVLIDPKATALKKFRNLPHTINYAVTPEESKEAIGQVYQTMRSRYEELNQDDFAEDFEGSHIWVVIDEYYELTHTATRETIKKLESIASLGRASRIHIIFCTQRPTSEIVTGMIKSNVTATVALRTASPQESRNLIEDRGAENLQAGKEAYYKTATFAGELIKICVPYAEPEELKRVITHWTSQK